MEIPLYVIFHFSLLLLIFYLCIIFIRLITMCLSVFLLGFILSGTLYASWTWSTVSFPMLGKFSAVSFQTLLGGPYFLSSPSGISIMWMLTHLVLSQRFVKLSSFLLVILFSTFCFAAVISTILSSRSLTCSSASVILLLILYSVLSTSVSSLVLLGIWKVFLASSPFCFWDLGLSSISLLWILFLEICLYPLHLFSVILSCSFTWDIILCFFILIKLLWCGFCCGGCRIVALLISSVW